MTDRDTRITSPLTSRRARRSRSCGRVLVALGASDGAVTDLGPQLSFWFVDPDGMHIAVDWVRDPSLQGFHAPRPVEVAMT